MFLVYCTVTFIYLFIFVTVRGHKLFIRCFISLIMQQLRNLYKTQKLSPVISS